MTPEERSSAENGIWLCEDHARAVDAPDSKFTVDELRTWKRLTDEDSWRSVMENVHYGPNMRPPTPDALRDRLRAAASADLEVFRQTERWPRSTVALTLKVDHVDETLSTQALANAVATLDDLILVAAPGMGKTTTMFQIAEGVLAGENGTPLIVPLGDWATESDGLLASVLKRGAYAAISEADFRAVAAKSGVVLLLDGWNELDAAARERARVQVANLKAELPELGLVISTRQQSLDIPFAGTRIELLPLDNVQQMAIARALRGVAGVRLIDQAWRTAGVRELVTIPLYLTALLSLPEDTPFPTTKEEVLRRFVAVHEEEARRAAALREATGGFQQDYLLDLAAFATAAANTAITDANARRTVSQTTRILVNDGQIAGAVQPDAVLNALVSNHVLVRLGDLSGYSFQHQQFQEWYASYDVERLMMRAANDGASRDKLKAEIFNHRHWEEAILFAIERSARGTAAMKAACSAVILTAFEVDPILAAEMIFRATDEVWSPISETVREFIGRWHAPGKVDRAVRFMVTSGRSEFGDLVWPMISNPDQQVHLSALRSGARFRPSVLGTDAPQQIASLPTEIRKHVLQEIALHSAMDGLDLATAIAKAGSDPEVKAAVVKVLSFRRADRHAAELLEHAEDATYDILARQGHLEDVAVETVQQRILAARARRAADGESCQERLRALLYERTTADQSAEVTDLVGQMEIDPKHDSGDAHWVYEASKRYPQAVAQGLLQRIREDRTLFYGADDMLAAAGIALEDDALCQIALELTGRRDNRAEAAASVLGPQAVGRMIDEYLSARTRIRDADGRHDQAAADRYHDLRARIHHTPGGSLIAAVQARAASANFEEIEELAGLLARSSDGDNDRDRPFSSEGLAAIGALAQEWGDRMLAAGNADRRQTGAMATLVSHAPSASLLPLLKRLLDDNLRRFRAFREEAKASGWRTGKALDEARTPHRHEYQRAFIAIREPETDALMQEYLADEHFGQLAAQVLAMHWSEAHEPKPENRFLGGVDFSRVDARRATCEADPAATSTEAEAIFGVVDTLLTETATEDQKKLALALGIVGARLPHGQKKATIDRLIAQAPREARAALLLALILSGETVDIKLVALGIAETFEAAKAQPWILTQSEAYQLRDWLRLLPFCTPVVELPAIVRGLPEAQRTPHLFEELVRGLGDSPFAEAEDVLFRLAEDDPRFYRNYQWRTSVLRLGTASAARRLADLTVAGSLVASSADNFHWGSELAELISGFPETHAYVRELLKSSAPVEQLAVLASALAHNPGAEGLMSLVEFEIRTGHLVCSWRSIERVVNEHVPSESWKGAYDVVPVPATELRSKLLAVAGVPTDPAARCLTAIDRMRDEYGGPETEPRHPDLASGKRWPILAPDPDVE